MLLEGKHIEKDIETEGMRVRVRAIGDGNRDRHTHTQAEKRRECVYESVCKGVKERQRSLKTSHSDQFWLCLLACLTIFFRLGELRYAAGEKGVSSRYALFLLNSATSLNQASSKPELVAVSLSFSFSSFFSLCLFWFSFFPLPSESLLTRGLSLPSTFACGLMRTHI